jgi:hypothetical protein
VAAIARFADAFPIVRLAVLVAIAVVGCTRVTPLARVVGEDVCIESHAATQAVDQLERDGTHVQVCYDGACIVFDTTTSTVSRRQLDPPPEPSERFFLDSGQDGEEGNGETISLCDRLTDVCSRVRIPVEDVRTVAMEVNATGTELYAIITNDAGVHLDTYDLRSRRIGRISLGISNGREHFWSLRRVGTALIVSESIAFDITKSASTNTLVAPFTGAIRRLAQGSAIELDQNTLLVLEGRSASIVEARTFRTLATHTAPGKPIADHSSAAGIRVQKYSAIAAFSDPPSVATIDIRERRFVTARRLPVCDPPPPIKRPPAPIMNE